MELTNNFEIRNKTNVPTKFILQVFVREIHEKCVRGIHLHFGTNLKIFLWNPENGAPIQCTVGPRDA